MKVTKYSNDFEIIAGGSVILKDKDANVRLHVNMNPEYRFCIDLVWNFYNDDTLNDVKSELGEFSDKIIEINIYNAQNPFGTGTRKPVHIATFMDGMKLYCNYMVKRPAEDNPRVFTYSLYLGK